MTFALLASPLSGWQIIRLDGERASVVGAVVDDTFGDRVVALLNRHGLEDVPMEPLPGLDAR